MTTFLHTAGNSNITQNWTTLDHPELNNQPNAVVIVTSNLRTNEPVQNKSIGVWYDGLHWTIFNQDQTPMTQGTMFNVLVTESSDQAFATKTTVSTTNPHVAILDHPSLNSRPDARFLVTPNYGTQGPYNNNAIGVWYDGSHWTVYNQDFSKMPTDTMFNIFIHDSVFMFEAANPNTNWQTFNNAATDNQPNALIFATQYWTGVYNPHEIGVWYTDNRWAIYNQDKADLPQNAKFFLAILRPIPELVGGQGVNLTLGPTDFNSYVKPIKTKKAVMVFIDFPDTKKRREDDLSPALTKESAEEMSKHLLGMEGQAKDIFKTQSHGKFDLDVTVKSDLDWKVLAKKSSDYVIPATSAGATNYVDMTKLVKDVKTLFGELVNFDKYDMTFIVQPKLANTLNVNSSYGFSPSYTDLNVIAFGADSYRNRYVNLVHEVGHQIGLPDLYPQGNIGSTLGEDFRQAGVVHSVGSWSIMADMQFSESFLGWEQHKMGWLDDSRKIYLPELSTTPTRFVLSPLTASSGLSMIVIPLGDAEKPSKVFVIEIGQDIYGRKEADGKLVRDGSVNDKKGVLLYTVDARVSSGALPIKVIPRIVSKNDQYGQLFEAAYSDKQSGTYKDDATNVEIKVDVYKNEDSTYTVDIKKNA